MRLGGWLVVAAALGVAAPVNAGPRAMALDQCSDQYVLALSDPADIVGLSARADDQDSYMRGKARGLPQRRATLESVVAARPQVVVRYWGGDARLADMLDRRGVKVVRIEEATDFAGLRSNLRAVAAALDRRAEGEAIVARMDGQLARSRGAWRGASALYLTPSGFTAGKGTLIEAVLAAAGLKGAARRPGYSLVSLETLVMDPPRGFVLGFFDAFATAMERWGAGRHRVLNRLTEGRTIGYLPGAIAGCPGWFAADGVEALAKAAPR